MNIFLKFLDIGSNVYVGLLSIWFLYKILTPKKPGRFLRPSTIIAVLSYCIVLELVSLLSEYDIYLLLNHLCPTLLTFIYSILFFKGSVIKKITSTAVFYLIIYIISYSLVVFWLLLGYSYEAMHTGLIFISTMIVVHFLYWVAYILFIKAYNKINIKLNKLETILITTIFVLSLIYQLVSVHTAAVLNHTKVTLLMLVSVVFLTCLNIITYYMIYRISKNHHIEQENALLKMEKEYQKTKYEDTIRQSEQIKKLRHDYKNNLLVIRSLAEDNNTEDVIDFISQGIERINATKMHIETNNEIVNAIVNTKMSEAAQQGIKVNFISISDFDGIDDFDLCNLISNLFDNAITAVSNCETKIIKIKITRNDELYTIKMSNTIAESIIEANPELATTKEDNISHGYGTKIIKDIADKYNGELDYYEEDGMFNFLVHITSKLLITSAVPV